MAAGVRCVVCVVAALGLFACTDDFDALFGDAGAVDGGDAGASDGATRDAAAIDAASSCASAVSCTCDPGATCSQTCDADKECNATARDSDLTYRCEEHANGCIVSCKGRATCDVTCDNEGPCSVDCGENAKCVLRCTDRPESCTLKCDEADKKDCGNGVFTCSPSCP